MGRPCSGVARRPQRQQEEDMKHSQQASSHEAQPKARHKSGPAAAGSSGPDGDIEVKIREAAYYRYLARGAENGRELEDWLQAESEVIEHGKTTVTSH
jgi:hypothetical protein